MHHGQVVGKRTALTSVEALGPSNQDRRFGRMFNEAEQLPGDLALAWLGRADGDIQAKDSNPNNDRVPAGFTFLGQFIDHDITLTGGQGSVGTSDSLLELRNERHPALNLDSVYGNGPDAHGNGRLYENFSFILSDDSADLHRGDTVGTYKERPIQPAVIGDPRNDENLIIAQLHLTFLRLHNKLMKNGGAPTREKFEEVRKKIINTYQHIVLNEYLALHVPADVLEFIRRDQLGRYTSLVNNNAGHLAMPVEFSAAAFRFGHSQVRARYLINRDRKDGKEFSAVLFATDEDDDDDLNGGVKRPFAESVDFALFFGLPGDDPATVVMKSHAVDGLLSGPLFTMRAPAISDPPLSLAERNLRRGRDQRIISGQDLASELMAEGVPGVRHLSADELGLPEEIDLPGVSNPADVSLHDATPLWFYILKEAEAQFHGLPEDKRGVPVLGPIGGAIVAETLVGLLRHDDGNHHHPNLARVLPIDVGPGADNSALIDSRFDTMAKLTDFAGVK